MAKLDGTLLLTKKQVKKLNRGKTVDVEREGKTLFIGVKTRFCREKKLVEKIARLKRKLIEMRGGEKECQIQKTSV